MTKATHNGTCQCCGRVQAIQNGGLAKHGYTVDYGFFNGTCSGSGQLPLEQDDSILIDTVARLRAYAAKQDANVAAGTHGVTIFVRSNSTDQIIRKTIGKAEWIESEARPHWDEDTVEYWWAKAKKMEGRLIANRAEYARRDAQALIDLRDRTLGQPLQEREPADAPQRKREYFSSRREAYTRQAELAEQGIKSRVNSRNDIFLSYTI